MSYESGGRADKYGNHYENCYLVILLLRLIREELTSVTVEPLGEYGDYVEFISEQKNGIIKYYQCKGSNTSKNSWSISDLQKHKVFQRSKQILEANNKNLYYFISPLPYSELDSLCERARTNSSPDEFISYQLTNDTIRAIFRDCVTAYGYDINCMEDKYKAVQLLSRCYFEKYFAGTEAEQDLEERIGFLFTGKASTVRVLLEEYVNDNHHYGRPITANDVLRYLEERDIHLRDYQCDPTILGRIGTLNTTYWDTYYPVGEDLFHRTETDMIIRSIENGRSVILHGKAGMGKSGCLEETIHHLKEKRILYLSIKLDKKPPHSSADTYGNELGLPESPVYCLAKLSADQPCVLILDQLDSLRWTGNHSSDALDVCKELIRQADSLNRFADKKISIIFASRTFDLENDRGLSALFKSKEHLHSLVWEKVNVTQLSKNDVVQIIGSQYNNLSSRLQKILLTPSSLYVWSRLDESTQNNSISSVYELMDRWWKQIQQKCALLDLQTQDAIICKDEIVNFMETRAVYSLPKTMFTDHAKEIDAFISCGLLSSNPSTKSISFTHQSFLDYFLTADTMKKIYRRNELKNLFGGKNDQTPIIRYRLLTVLQTLLESDPTLFVEQACGLLEYPNMRFYFKCAVFEVIGQSETPTPEIFHLIDEYSAKPEWADYINQVVIYRHPPFVKHIVEISKGDFFSDSHLALLKSISDREPDYIANILKPFALQNPNIDKKIFHTLCYDINDDSEEMFELRVQLLRKNPALFHDLLGLTLPLKHTSTRAVVLFEIILESWRDQRKSSIYLGEKNVLSDYAKLNAWSVVTKLFPKICEYTSGYLPRWPYYLRDTEYKDWNYNRHDESTVRTIIEIVKVSFAECAQVSPDDLLAYVNSINYPVSAVSHECLMHAVLNLPVDYADEAMAWLLRSIDKKIFVYSADDQDYLSYAKQIIQKFSTICNLEYFSRLEHYICSWKDSSESMLNTFRHRREVQNSYHTPVFYAYWGHFQKELLPSMDCSKLSAYAKSLLEVVNRNTWINVPHFHCGILVGDVKSVASPVDAYTERLSDKTWLQIVTTPQEKMSDHRNVKENKFYYIEANHMSFASALGKQAKREPLRFAKLSLSFPQDCYHGYIDQVLCAFSDPTAVDEFDINLVSEVIRCHGRSNDMNLANAVCSVVEHHAKEVWPDDIIDLIVEIAINHPNPAKGEYTVTSSLDPENKSVDMLLNNALNCARGHAYQALSALFWEHPDLSNSLRSVLLAARSDPSDAVRFAALDCVIPFYNIDRSFAVEIFNSLLESDLRIVCAHGSWEIMSREYTDYGSRYRAKLIDACLSEIDDLAEGAAGLICAVAIIFNDQDALRFILSHSFSNKQQEKICQQAAYLFNSDEYHDKCKIILLHLIDHTANELLGFRSLFLKKRIILKRDEEFLIHLMESHQSVRLLHAFLDYLYESDEDICGFAQILRTASNSLTRMTSLYEGRLAVHDLVKCVIRLFDKGKSKEPILEICLDILDDLFRSNLTDIKPLSEMIDNFE